MAKDKTDAAPEISAAAALDVARQEHARWERVLAALTVAATAEQMAREQRATIEQGAERVKIAEAEADAKVAAAHAREVEAEADTKRRIEAFDREVLMAQKDRDEFVAARKDEIDDKQAELNRIGRDLDLSREQLKSQIETLSTERNTLLAELDRLKARFAA